MEILIFYARGGGLKTYIAHNTMATSPGSLPGKAKAIFSVRAKDQDAVSRALCILLDCS
jgi:hypothetical protein